MWRTLLQVCSLLIVAILESSCGGGRSTIPASAPHSTVPTPTLLRTLYRVVNGGDRMTTIGPDERSSYPLEGQVYYVPDQPASGRTTLNRLINSGGTDHADAINNLMGYSQDMVLGFPWTGASGLGMAQLSEFLNSGTGDYALLAPSESLPGYSPQALAVYGYPRFGNASEVLLSLSAGGITVESNKVAEGVVWRWFWNGVEFENNFAYGGEIQAAFYVGDNPNLNPTEAGDFYGRENPILAHGSPVVRFENQGNTQITRAVPLNWDPTVFGGDQDHPVIWDSVILGKDLTLNFNNMGPVAKYTTHVVLPGKTSGSLTSPITYLRGNFNRYWTYDAQSQQLNEVTGHIVNGCSNNLPPYVFNTDFGGVIISDSTAAYAMGIYGVSTAHGGWVGSYGLWSFPCGTTDTSESAYNFNVLSPASASGWLFPAGESTYNAYMITESVQNVAAKMSELYALGVR